MQRYTILTTSKLAGGTAPINDGRLQVGFRDCVRELEDNDRLQSVWMFIDWLLPECSGLELCRRLRLAHATQDLHIVMLLDHDDDEDKRRAIKAGADDYVIGPLSRRQIIERLKVAQETDFETSSERIEAGPLSVDLDAYVVQWSDKPLWLPPTQIRLLSFMMQHPGRVLSREQIIAGMKEPGEKVDPQTVSVWMKRLRRSLAEVGAEKCLRTVRPKGYAFDISPKLGASS